MTFVLPRIDEFLRAVLSDYYLGQECRAHRRCEISNLKEIAAPKERFVVPDISVRLHFRNKQLQHISINSRNRDNALELSRLLWTHAKT